MMNCKALSVLIFSAFVLYCFWSVKQRQLQLDSHYKLWHFNEIRKGSNENRFINYNRNTSQTSANEEEENITQKVKKEDLLELDDVFISVKTSKQFHKTRISIILNTWWNQAKKQTYFFTDDESDLLNNLTDGHFINTKCGNKHFRDDLNCKMQSEYTFSLKMDKKWWCHFDDDNYVNIDNLLNLLCNFNIDEDFYIGKRSLKHKISVNYRGKPASFSFATGGAGICISRPVLAKMKAWASNGKFQATGRELGQPDDVTMGFILNDRLGIELTKIETLHSHLEQLSATAYETLRNQITLSYRESNTINMPKAIFTVQQDPSRIYSLHCQIYPDIEWCLNKSIPTL